MSTYTLITPPICCIRSLYLYNKYRRPIFHRSKKILKTISTWYLQFEFDIYQIVYDEIKIFPKSRSIFNEKIEVTIWVANPQFWVIHDWGKSTRNHQYQTLDIWYSAMVHHELDFDRYLHTISSNCGCGVTAISHLIETTRKKWYYLHIFVSFLVIN